MNELDKILKKLESYKSHTWKMKYLYKTLGMKPLITVESIIRLIRKVNRLDK